MGSSGSTQREDENSHLNGPAHQMSGYCEIAPTNADAKEVYDWYVVSGDNFIVLSHADLGVLSIACEGA